MNLLQIYHFGKLWASVFSVLFIDSRCRTGKRGKKVDVGKEEKGRGERKCKEDTNRDGKGAKTVSNSSLFTPALLKTLCFPCCP